MLILYQLISSIKFLNLVSYENYILVEFGVLLLDLLDEGSLKLIKTLFNFHVSKNGKLLQIALRYGTCSQKFSTIFLKNLSIFLKSKNEHSFFMLQIY